jgi:hypothetical protein
LHTKIQIIKEIILIFRPRKRRSRIFELFKSGNEKDDGWALSDGFEWLGGSTMKLVSCRGRNWFAEEQTTMERPMDDRRASVDGYGCGGEGGGGGRFVSWLWAKIQLTEEGVGMIVMYVLKFHKMGFFSRQHVEYLGET